ncbi:MAG: hypothetical protein QXV04_03540, partial [Desulfurococcaceae archaeon]
MSEKPLAAFILILISGVMMVVSSILFMIGASLFIQIPRFFPRLIASLALVIGFAGGILGILILLGAFMINTGNPNKVRTWSIIVLVACVLSILPPINVSTLFGGIFIGFTFGIVGAILGLTWRPLPKEKKFTETPP